MNKHPINIVIDLETLDTEPTAQIISIGAFCMETESEFYVRIIPDPDPRFTVSKFTLDWWDLQSTAAREEAFGGDVDIKTALEMFTGWVCQHTNIRMWGNGTMFDNAILLHAYKVLGLPAPWSYRADMCYRTLKNLRPDVEAQAFIGMKHTALADAKHEARHLRRLLQATVPRTDCSESVS